MKMKKSGFLVAIVALAIIAVSAFTSCKKTHEGVKMDNSLFEIYNKTVGEFEDNYNQIVAFRSADEGVDELPEEYSRYKPDYLDIEGFLQFVNSQSYSESTRKILSQLPSVFVDNVKLPTIEEIANYAIPTEEKEILAQTLGLVDGVKAFALEAQTRSGDKYSDAIDLCYSDYLEDLGMAVGTGLVSGVAAACGGPVAAGVACVLTGSYAVYQARVAFKRCMRDAKKLINEK